MHACFVSTVGGEWNKGSPPRIYVLNGVHGQSTEGDVKLVWGMLGQSIEGEANSVRRDI